MKNFVLGLLVGLAVGAGALFGWMTMQGGGDAATATSAWVDAMQAPRAAIAAKAIANGTLAGAGVGIALPTIADGPSYQGVGANGTIVLRGGEAGQLVVLVPMLANGRVSWQCIGGSKASVPEWCAGSTPSTLPD
jgi:hypothetical protein